MAGTWATYQDADCTAVRFERSRGWQADVSVVEILAKTLLALEPIKDLGRPSSEGKASFDAIVSEIPGAIPIELKDKLRGEGTLVMAEHVDGRTFPLAVSGLFVARVERFRQSYGAEQVAMFRLSLVDERYFWPRGVLRKLWSINRRRGDGTIAVDSLNKGQRWRLDEYVKQVVAEHMFRKPTIEVVPSSWEVDAGAREFKRRELASRVLADIIAKAGAEEPCLRLDRKIAIHEAGEGLVAPCQTDKANGTPTGGNGAGGFVESDLVLADGERRVLELGFPEEFLLVVGGQRIASVALDSCDPVLKINGAYEPLNEETIRRLTNGKKGLDWLRKYVLVPSAYQNLATEGVSDNVAEVLRDAWRLYRIPLAVSASAGNPGPNAHLLPMLPRAETKNGKRLPITVETFKFTTVHRTLATTAEGLEAAAAARNLVDTEKAIRELAKGFAPLGVSPLDQRREPSPVSLGSAEALTSDQVANAWRDVALVRDLKKFDPLLGGQYEAALKEKMKVDDALNSTSSAELYDVMQRALELGKGDAASDAAKTKALTDALKRVDANLARKQADAKKAAEQGKKPGKRLSAVSFQNLPLPEAIKPQVAAEGRPSEASAAPSRPTDLHAQVDDHAAGVFRTSELAGHVEKEDVHDGAETRFVPKPVRVIFGTVVRPRTDAPNGTPMKVATGDETVVPDTLVRALSDEATDLVLAYKRIGRGQAQEVDPTKDDFRHDLATRLEKDELVELIGLDGKSNIADLREQAIGAAKIIFRRQDVIRTTTHLLGRPWAINPDGIVKHLVIEMRHVTRIDGIRVPCGYQTTVHTGSNAFAVGGGGSRERPRAQRSEDDREGLRP